MEHALNNLRQALYEAATKLGLPVFWRWWAATLAPMMPAASRTAVQRRRLRPVIAFGDGVAVVWELRVVDGTLTLAEVGRVPLAGDAGAIAHAGRIAMDGLSRGTYGAPTTAPKVFIALPHSQVLRKQFTLPAAVEENLKEALAFDLDRHTPFRPDQLYFDAVVVGRDAAKKEIRVDWAAVLKTLADPARRHAESWGATVVGITPESLDGASGEAIAPATWSKLNLLPLDERPDARAWRRPQVWLPVVLIAVMALVGVILPIWQKRDYVIALNETTEQARVQAAASDALRQQLDRATGDYNFALGKKYAYPSTVQLLDDVTRLLPDDTWLTQMEIKSIPKGKEPHREIMLRGESANAGRLVPALEESKLFEQAAPRSPTTKIQPGPGEVFDVGAQLKALPPPEPIQLVSVQPAAAGAPAPAAPQPAAAATPAAAGAGAPAASATPAAPASGAAPGARPAAPPAATTGAGEPAATAAAEPAAPASAPPSALPSAPPAPPQVQRQSLPPGTVAPPRGPLSAGGLAMQPRGPSQPSMPGGVPGMNNSIRPQVPVVSAPAAPAAAVPATAPGSGPAASPGAALPAADTEDAASPAPTTAPLQTRVPGPAGKAIVPPKGSGQ